MSVASVFTATINTPPHVRVAAFKVYRWIG